MEFKDLFLRNSAETNCLVSRQSEDCVNRHAVKEQMIKYGFSAPDMTVTEFVEGLSSVDTQPRTGYILTNIESAKLNLPNFCPNCGAKLVKEV